VQQEFDALADATNPGLSVALSFDVREDVAAPFIASGARPKVVVLREQGVNSQFEMAAAFERAGFTPVDVHMSDLQAGRIDLADFHGLAACGGFSYGDVLGAGQGWAKSILFNARLRDEFAAFFGADTFALGVCNGCQMMAHLAPIIPGAEAWPTFHRNRSEQFEARFVMVEVPTARPSCSRAWPAAACRSWSATARAGGVPQRGRPRARLLALRYIDNHGHPAQATRPTRTVRRRCDRLHHADGRFTIMMPHPERTARTLQMSWAPQWLVKDSPDASPWLRMFRNARAGWGP
jgi:phosphoribosylformylglycinamidine synthase